MAGACSSGGGDPGGAGGAAGASGALTAGGAGAGGAAAGGAAQGGAAGMSPGGVPGAGGAPSIPAGQLMCGGKLCHAGGHCAADGSCPAFLSDCFTSPDKSQRCDTYCASQGFVCAAKACNADGSPIDNGYTWVSFSAANSAECMQGGFPDGNSFDSCSSPIWLSLTKPADDVIRCCCKG